MPPQMPMTAPAPPPPDIRGVGISFDQVLSCSMLGVGRSSLHGLRVEIHLTGHINRSAMRTV